MLVRESYLFQNLNILLTVNKEFRKSVNDLKRHIDFLNEQNIEDECIQREHSAINKSIEKLLKEYNLPFDYKGMLEYHLDRFDNENIDVSDYVANTVPHVFETKDNHGREVLALELPHNTSLKQIQKHWKSFIMERVEKYHKDFDRNLSYSKNTYRDIRIYKLKQQRKTGEEIVKIINSEFKDAKIEYKEVSNYIKRLKEKANKLISGKSK